MACSTCGGVLDCFCPGAPVRTGGVGVLDAPAEPVAGEPPVGILPRLHKRGGDVDVLVYRDRLVLCHVPGPGAARIGMWIGMIAGVVGAVAGRAIGCHLDAAKDADRIRPLASMSAVDALRTSPKNVAVPVRGLAQLDVRSEMGGGRIVLRDGQRGSMKLRWQKAHTQDIDVPAALASMYGGLVRCTRQSPLKRVLIWLAAIVVGFILAIAALIAAVQFLGTPDDAADAAFDGCNAFYSDVAALGDGPLTYDQLAPAAADASPHFQRAASLDPAWVEGADAMAWLEANLARTAFDPDPGLAMTAENRLAVVDRVCGAG